MGGAAQQGITAYIDEGERDVPGVMGRLAMDLEQQGHRLVQFNERYRLYWQKREELEADPEAPQGLSAFVGRTVARSAVKLGRRVLGVDIALDLMGEEDALQRNVPAPSICEAIQDLKDFLKIFPTHGLAHKAQQFLQNAL